MRIKAILIVSDEDDIVSADCHMETYDKNFVEEVKKFVCPFRLSDFLTQQEGMGYTTIKAPLKDEEYDLIIDLSDTAKRIIEEKVQAGELLSIVPSAYIKATPHLDKYGN